MNMDGTNWLACARFTADLGEPARVYPLASRSIVKDLVSDLSHIFAQYEMTEPRLQSKTSEPGKERLQSHEERSRLDGYPIWPIQVRSHGPRGPLR
jgi:succinate dehydrogenase / fumarate reductase iron-sulfur subunit